MLYIRATFAIHTTGFTDCASNTNVLMYRCLNGAAPRYLTELATPVGSTARRRLRSASSTDLVVPATRRSTIGDRAFAVAGPRAWNSLPPAVRSSATYNTFRQTSNLTFLDYHSHCDNMYFDYVQRRTNRPTYITLHKKDGYRQLNVRQLGSLRPWEHRGKCYMDRKIIQCLSNASQHVHTYLQPFTSYSEILVGNRNFFLHPCI